jgi:AcrR family transcriptional regulator
MTARFNGSTEGLRADARRNRQRLLEIAHEAFVENGVSASMDDIARRAGVGSGTLYRHFPTRDALILALVADDLERLTTLADELRASDAPDALERWLVELVEHNRTYRGLAESIIAATGQPTALGAACDRIHTAGQELVIQAQRTGTVRPDVAPGDAIDLAAAVAWITQHDPDNRRSKRLLQVATDGLHTPRPDPPPTTIDPCATSTRSTRSSMTAG